MKILILNGSLGGEQGNSSVLIDTAIKFIKAQKSSVKVLHLADLDFLNSDLKNLLSEADAFLFTSGTYWDSWGSPMQKFLEHSTQFEASDLFFGKPAGVMISMHSVGGKGVLSRLQGVLNTMGLLIPPMSGLVYSLAAHMALKLEEKNFDDDFWSLDDIEIIVHNLIAAKEIKGLFKSWPVDHKDPTRRWL